MNDFYFTLITDALLNFVNFSIKNPDSKRANTLKSRLIGLRDGLNTLIQTRWPNG